ncbi:serum amyloid P-component [Egretta garzetta]|nr:serum amyloid P-component [Egretta garzetta]
MEPGADEILPLPNQAAAGQGAQGAVRQPYLLAGHTDVLGGPIPKGVRLPEGPQRRLRGAEGARLGVSREDVRDVESPRGDGGKAQRQSEGAAVPPGLPVHPLSCPQDLYRKVFVFRKDPSDAYVVLRAKLEQPLQNFTVCLRSYTDLTRPHSLFSYATKAQDNEILLFKPKPSEYRLYVGGKFVTFRVPEGHGDWEHVCASWESATGIAEFWLNGKPWPRKGLQRGYTVGVEAAILLGQEQDAFGGGFDVYNSFSGELAEVYLWDVGLSPDKMRAAYQSLYLPPAVLAWKSLVYEVKGDVVVKPRLRKVLGP